MRLDLLRAAGLLAALTAGLALTASVDAQVTFTVNTTGDGPDVAIDGVCDADAGTPGQQCTLRAAIQESEATTVQDAIHFNIPGTGPHTISVVNSDLPVLFDPLVIDGYTQPGAVPNSLGPGHGTDAVIMIEIVNGGGRGRGLRLCFGTKTIRGLAIGGFGEGAISIECGATPGHAIEGCFIGTDAAGATARPNAQYGIIISGTSGNRVGGTDPAARNLISGNGTGASALGGVHIGGQNPSGNLVQGNLIGTNAVGTAGIPNGGAGVRLQHAGNGAGIVIGGTTPAERNVISGNALGFLAVLGVGVTADFSGVRLEGNFIGTDVTGALPLPNTNGGVRIQGLVSQLRTGGTAAGAGNRIAHNGGAGVAVAGSQGGNRVLGNSISGNSGIGIDLGPAGVTLNDAGDPDAGANRLQNYPVITSVTPGSGADLEVTYIIDTDPANATYPFRVEFFLSDDAGQGATFLGSDTYSAANYGGCGSPPCERTATFVPAAAVPGGATFVATATDDAGNTSEFTASPVVATEPSGSEAGLALHGPIPNPAMGRTVLSFDLPAPVRVRLAVHDALGRVVATLVDAERPAGRHATVFETGSLAPGVYLVRLAAADAAVARHLLVLR